jgi:hypothetical protein
MYIYTFCLQEVGSSLQCLYWEYNLRVRVPYYALYTFLALSGEDYSHSGADGCADGRSNSVEHVEGRLLSIIPLLLY